MITTSPQVFLVAGGHFSGEAHGVSINDTGLPVLEMVVDYQSRPHGGDGFMQLLNFRPDFDTIDVTTYSPTLDAFETDTDSRFSFSLDFAVRLGFPGAPTGVLTSPLNDGPGDTDPADGRMAVNTAPPHFELQLTDLFPGVDDLPGSQLGQAFGTAITLDRDAAGTAWHVDPASTVVAAGHFDLLTVLTHELGHVLGIDHGYSSAQLSTIDGMPCALMLTNKGLTFIEPATGRMLGKHDWEFGRYRVLQPLVLADGKRKWKQGRYGNGQVLLLPDGDQLLVLSEEGEIVLLRATPETWVEVAKQQVLEGRTWNHPVLIGNRLYVRNGEEAACFEMPLDRLP